MEAENSQDFKERLGQWVASQGFWFQVRYSMSGGGGWSMAVFHLLKIGFRILILVGIVALGVGYFLVKRVGTPEFQQDLKLRFSEKIGAPKTEMLGFQRTAGEAQIRRLGATGGPHSFFESFEASNLNFNMGYLSGLTDRWDAGTVRASSMDIEIKAGTNSAEEAAAAAASFFETGPGFAIDGVEATKARLSWGYSRRTYGKIEGAKMRAIRVSGGWRISFSGGTFSQNWLKDLEILELVVLCTPEGLDVERAEMAAGRGRVLFTDVKVGGGEVPAVSGRVKLDDVPLRNLLPPLAEVIVGGSVSGNLELGGSTNSPEGVTFAGEIALSPRDVISIRDRVEILGVLDIVDAFNNYKRLDFDRGGFRLETGGGEMVAGGITLEAGDLLGLRGRVEVSRTGDDEIARMLKGELGVRSLAARVRNAEAEQVEEEDQIGGKREESKNEDGDEAAQAEFFNDLDLGRTARRERAELIRNDLLFDGSVSLSLPADAFRRSEALQREFPADPATGRITIDVPVEGEIESLTRPQSNEIRRLHKLRD